MGETILDEYRQLMQEQGEALLDVMQSVAVEDLDFQVPSLDGIDVLSDLAIGLEMMTDDFREMMAERVRTQVVEEQSRALLDAVQSVALGELDIQVEVPEGVEVLSELAVGIEMMVDDLREMMAEQERARAEIEGARQQAEAALAEVLAVQRRYLQQEWEGYASDGDAVRGYLSSVDEEGPTTDAWLPGMTASVEQVEIVVETGEEGGATLALPIHLYGEVIGAMGFSLEGMEGWSEDEIGAAEAIVEQVAQALESQRLFDEAQEATFLMGERVRDLDCLNDIGRRMEAAPPIPEFFQWIARHVAEAMRHADVCLVAVEYEDQVYGMAEAVNLSRQMVQALRIGDEIVGRIYVSYSQDHEFLDEESALLGDVARRVSGYVESRRLLREAETRAGELAMLNEMGRELSSLREIGTVIESVHRHSSRLIDATNFYIALYDAEFDELSFPYYAEGEQVRRVGRRRAGKGMTEHVIRTRDPLLIKENVAAWLAGQGVDQIGQSAESWLGVPMMVGGQVIGVLAVQSYTTPRLYIEHHRELLISIANQAAIAIQNARLFEQTQAALEQVQAVHQRYLRESWQDYLKARGRAVQPAYLYDQSQVVREADLDLPEIHQALAQKKLVVGDGDGEGGQTIALPISLRGQPIGALAIEPPPGSGSWSEEELALVQTVSEQLALAIDGARLFEETQMSEQRERTLREMAERVRAAADMEALLKAAAQEIRRALGASRATVRLGLETDST